ncbi:MAG: 50S ribosomal protein L11 methyltransferase [Fimbriimonadaceae bacterium]|jgi:ribosomal protein L11 methyltransferase|nr:50S ribosomal protein L11 methyltransferase [Fimbriimonadaceae bacterium]
MSVWIEVKAYLDAIPEDWSALADLFDRFGLPGTLQQDSPPAMSAYIAPGDEGMIPDLTVALKNFGALRVETKEIEEIDWAESWKQFFKPRRVGERIIVRPTWEEAELLPGDIELVLDPGQAFGTGDHPTTRGCLQLLEEVDLVGKSVADIGCGSGILSVAAGKFGAGLIHCVDIEQPSVSSTLENAERNGVELIVKRGTGFDPLPADQKYDVVLSNIISAALIVLAPQVATRLHAGGIWIASGIIVSNWPEVAEVAKRNGFTMVENLVEGDWVAAKFLR